MPDSEDVTKPYPRKLDWMRYLCAFLLYMYGGSKLAHMQFSLPAEYSKRPVGSLTGYELTWFYYGYSYAYACIVGFIQILGASLLLFRKTALAGATLILPVIGNILLINIFILKNDYGPEIMALIISASMLILLWHERDRIIRVLWSEQPSDSRESRRIDFSIRAFIIATVLGLLIFGVVGRQMGHQHEIRGTMHE